MLLFRDIVLASLMLCYLASASSLTKPPQSALIIAFEKSYDQSLLAHTLSDRGIDSTLIVLSIDDEKLYENLEGIEIIKLNTSSVYDDDDDSANKAALEACDALIGDQTIRDRVGQINPTFVLFPALRHDACLLAWTEYISSIPIIVTYGPDESLYAVQRTGVALPFHTGGLWSGLWSNSRSALAHTDNNYVAPALKITRQQIHTETNIAELYSKVKLIMSAGDSILRTDFALLGHEWVEIGCHHCRGAHPLPAELQKQVVEFRLGTIAVTLDSSFSSLVQQIAQRLPQGRQGLAVAWKLNVDEKANKLVMKADNLFVHSQVDRQDLVGYARARVLLSHCGDTELLESAFHGTPVICLPRNAYEESNARRAVDLGFSISTNGETSAEAVMAAVEHIHKTATYREAARAVSMLIRDRPLPASDRLIYWLGYVARSTETGIKMPQLRANEIRTFRQDADFLSGFLIGTVVGASILGVATIILWIQAKSSQKHSRKDKKFNR